eukprot:4071071-Prymnesium_polylepis.1
MRLLLGHELLGLWRRDWMVLCRLPKRGSAAAPSAALGVTRRGGDLSAQPHTPGSSLSGSVGARCCGASPSSRSRTS